MRPDERDLGRLYDMLSSARIVQTYVEPCTLARFLSDQLLRDAVERRLEIIGEAARGVSPQFQAAHPEIPWRGIIGQRNVLAHDYGEIRYDDLWYVATIRVPELIEFLRPLVPAPPEAAS